VDGSTGACKENVLIPNVTLRMILLGANNATIAGAVGSPAVDVRVKGFMIQGFTVTGGNRGIHLQRNANAIIDSVTVQATGGEGILIDSMAFGVVTNSTIQNNPGIGIKVAELANARIGANLPEDGGAIAPNTISNNGADGILVTNKATAQIIGNTISGNAGNGVNVTASSSASTAGNLINSNNGSAVAATGRAYLNLGVLGSAAQPDRTTVNNGQYGIACMGAAAVSGNLDPNASLDGALSRFGPASGSFDPSCPAQATALRYPAANSSYIGGTVSGLTGSGLVLADNGGNDLTVSANGAFTFTTALAVGAAYAVTVRTQPSGQTCSVSNASGTVTSSNVTNVAVHCGPRFVAGGGAMGTARMLHTATLLPNGKILITGGITGTSIASNATASAELFDPTTNTSTALASTMTSARNQHTATLLNNGLVLIAGGSTNGNGDGISSAELFDPSNNTFTALGATMTTPRGGHTATLLDDGTVLIAGGFFNSATNSTTAEIYFPTSKTFTALAPTLTVGRSNHTATRLPDGTVLLAGGDPTDINVGNPSSSAEIYNPAGPSFSAVSSRMTAVRGLHESALLTSGQLSGQVLVTGGLGSQVTPGAAIPAQATAEVYNPATKAFTALAATMVRPLAGHKAVVLASGQLLILGGASDNTTAPTIDPTATTELFLQ
jgi:parallel beta-helix repeat protein